MSILAAVISGLLALVLLTVGILGFTGKLPGNSLIGLRIPEVRKSEDNWNTAHRIAAPLTIAAGITALIATLIALNASGWGWLLYAVILLASLILLGMGSAMAAHAMAQIDAQEQKAAEAERAAAGCCSAGANDEAAANGVASPEACASGTACGSCALNGSCEGGGAAFDRAHGQVGVNGAIAGGATGVASASPDMDNVRRAAQAQDEAR